MSHDFIIFGLNALLCGLSAGVLIAHFMTRATS